MSTKAVYNLADDQDREDRRKHLELISNAIGRMSGASATAKGWTVTLATAAFGAGAIKDIWYLHAVGVCVVGVFLYLDVRYLDTEKKFRDLYDQVLSNKVAPFSMDTRQIPSRPRNENYKSWSIKGLYLPLAIIGVILAVYGFATSTDDEGREPRQPTVVVTERPEHPAYGQHLTPPKREGRP